MARTNPLLEAFNAGEFSPRMVARVSLDKYPRASARLLNMIPLPQGGASRRPGTRFVKPVKFETGTTRLLPFEFSVEQTYILEFGEGYIRFFRNQGFFTVPDTDAAITNGTFDTDISDWTDQSTGAAAISHNATELCLSLDGAAGETAIAEQSVSVTTGLNQVHALKFEVVGVPGDKAMVRVGSASGGEQFFAEKSFEAGFHVISFTPTSGPMFLQFRNDQAKSVCIDNVSLIDDEIIEVQAPYFDSEIFQIKRSQSADVLFLTHPDNWPYKLSRLSDSDWSLTKVNWSDGPYDDLNTESASTLQPSATSGLGITITAAGTGNTPFSATDIGRLVRIQHTGSTDFGYAIITGFTSSTVVTADVRRAFNATTAASDWQLGSWSETTGWPATLGFFEQRLGLASTVSKPQTFWFSQSADIENFRPDSFVDSAIQVEDDDALDFTIAAQKVNKIRWLTSQRNLFIGTAGGEWVARSDGPVLTPTDIDVKQTSTHGSADIQDAPLSSIVLFVQRAGRKVRQLVFNFDTDNYVAPDVSVFAEHITDSGIVQLSIKEEPDNLVWCVLKNGKVAALTWLGEQNVIAWSQHIFGGDLNGEDAMCMSAATIPGDVAFDTDQDETWFIVRRTIDGATRTYVEFLEEEFDGPRIEDFDTVPEFESAVLEAQKTAFYVDSGLSATFGSPTTTISGLDHLEGQAVAVLGDGAILPELIVCVNGCIELPIAVTTAVVGLPYRHKYKSLKLNFGATAGAAVGQMRRVAHLNLLLKDAGRPEVGDAPDSLDTIPFRDVEDAMDTGVPLFTGEARIPFDGDFQRDPRIFIEGEEPLPFKLLGISVEMQTNDLV